MEFGQVGRVGNGERGVGWGGKEGGARVEGGGGSERRVGGGGGEVSSVYAWP